MQLTFRSADTFEQTRAGKCHSDSVPKYHQFKS